MKETDYQAILNQMTLEEKASLCSGLTSWLTKPVERLGVPSVYMSDGPHGLRKEKTTSGTNIMNPAETATCFPPAVTLASSWDPKLVEEVGAAIAEEAKALQVTTVLGPGVNIKRSPLCGRNFEYLSEDPFLSGRMGAAWVHGVQENDVGVSLKHYCANNQEYLRMSIDSIVDERALREIYLPAFEHIVKTEQPSTVMCSYNRLNGVYLSDNKRMLTDILRNEWGFQGMVVSDWGAVNDRVEGIRAGMDLEMPGNKGMNDKEILRAVRDGFLIENNLDSVVLRLLKFAFECKEKETDGGTIDFDFSHMLARKAAAQGAVLLKNEDHLLPLKKEQSIAVIGTLAKTPRYQGAGSSHINPPKTVSFVEVMQNEQQPFAYADGYTLKGDGYKSSLIKQACETAKGKDAVIVFIGLTDEYESEGFDRRHIKLPRAHNVLMEELTKVNQNLIVVLSCGSPVQIYNWESNAKAILNLYLGGQACGEAAYDVLYGAVNPSGKLAETFPLNHHDNVVAQYFPMGPKTVEYRESIYVGYRFYDMGERPVQYPFGFGLSYTTFEYSNLKLSTNTLNEGEVLTATFTVKNTGRVAGAEIAQLYISDVVSSIFRPKKELKGFEKVFLQPGEEKEISIALDDRSFSYYNVHLQDWHIESGEFLVLVGASSRDIRLSEAVNVISKNPDVPIPDYHQSAPWYYNLAKEDALADEIPAAQFEALYGVGLLPNTPFEKGELTANNSMKQLTCSGIGRLVYTVLTLASRLVAIGTENPDMITKSFQDMPLRSLSGMLEGMLSHKSVEGLVDMCNGRRGGFMKFLKGFKKGKTVDK